MYIGGYSIECLLKSRLMKQYGCDNLEQLEEELNRRQWLRVRHSVFTHSLELLLMLTGASDRLRSNAELWPHFQRVNQWIPAWRYAPDIGIGKDAAEFLDSVERVFHWTESNT